MAEIKIFDRWGTEGIKVGDPGLKDYLNFRPIIVPKTGGRHARSQFHKSNLNIVERLMNHLQGAGHRGKKHLLSSGSTTGKTATVWKIMKRTLEIMEKKTGKNPIEVLVRAVENAALREEISSYQMGGMMVRRAVITSPQRRIDLATRMIAQGSYQKSHGKGKPMAEALAEELLACYEKDSSKSYAVREKERIEREAAGSR